MADGTEEVSREISPETAGSGHERRSPAGRKIADRLVNLQGHKDYLILTRPRCIFITFDSSFGCNPAVKYVTLNA